MIHPRLLTASHPSISSQSATPLLRLSTTLGGSRPNDSASTRKKKHKENTGRSSHKKKIKRESVVFKVSRQHTLDADRACGVGVGARPSGIVLPWEEEDGVVAPAVRANKRRELQKDAG